MLKVKELATTIEELIESATINKSITLEGDEPADLTSMDRTKVIETLNSLLETKGEIDSS